MSNKHVCFTQFAEVLEFSPIIDPLLKSQLYYSKRDLELMKLEAKRSARDTKQKRTGNSLIRKRRYDEECFENSAEILDFPPIIDPAIESQFHYSQQMKLEAEQLALTSLIDRNRMIRMQHLRDRQEGKDSSMKRCISEVLFPNQAEQLALTSLIDRNRMIIVQHLRDQQEGKHSSMKRCINEVLFSNIERLNKRCRLSNSILVS